MKTSANSKKAENSTLTEAGQPALRRYFLKLLQGLFFPLAVIVIWEILSDIGWLNVYLIPPPSQIWDRLLTITGNGELTKHIGASLYLSLIHI